MTITERAPVVKAEAAPVTTWRRWLGPATFAVFGLVNIFVFGLLAHHGDVTFASSQPFAKVTIPNLSLPAAETCFACGALTLVLAALRAVVPLSTVWRRVTIGVVVFLFVLALMCWAGAGQTTTFNIVNLLQGTLSQSIPIMLGALTGVICSRSGVVNIGIEGQLLLGAFIAAMVASASGSLWLGLIAGAAAGCVVGALLAVFAIRYTVDQIILGVVLNGLILGLTGYLYDDLMVPYANTLNSPPTFSAVKIPLLADIPIIGPVFFQATIFLYLTYLALALVQVGLFSHPVGAAHPRGRRAPGRGGHRRHPGIRHPVPQRHRGGVLAGVGGAYLTIGSVGSFAKGMSSGEGYIALAAMIFGRYTPFGAIGAALLFGFSTQLQSILSTMNVPIQSNLLLATPYVVTIIVVAGLVGKVRPPKAEGIPYVKS